MYSIYNSCLKNVNLSSYLQIVIKATHLYDKACSSCFLMRWFSYYAQQFKKVTKNRILLRSELVLLRSELVILRSELVLLRYTTPFNTLKTT